MNKEELLQNLVNDVNQWKQIDEVDSYIWEESFDECYMRYAQIGYHACNVYFFLYRNERGEQRFKVIVNDLLTTTNIGTVIQKHHFLCIPQPKLMFLFQLLQGLRNQ